MFGQHALFYRNEINCVGNLGLILINVIPLNPEMYLNNI
jgi:hypothetical protein